MSGEILDGLVDGLFLAVTIGVLIAATEIGYRVGRRGQSGGNESTRSHIGMLEAALLGVLALLLGFTFSMAGSRFDTRRQLAVNEANAIGTTYLRAQILPEPSRREASNLLRRYVDVRLESYGSNLDQRKLQEMKDNTERLQNELWSRAIAEGKQDPRAITTGLFIQSLNEVIDLYSKQRAGMKNRVPKVIFVVIYVVAIISMGMVGYGAGMGGLRNLKSTMTAAVLIASVIFLIADLDDPTRGLVTVHQQSLVDLRDSLSKTAP